MKQGFTSMLDQIVTFQHLQLVHKALGGSFGFGYLYGSLGDQVLPFKGKPAQLHITN